MGSTADSDAPEAPRTDPSVRGAAAPNQQALCVLDALDPATPGLVLRVRLRVSADCGRSRLVRALRRLVDRHDALRTRFRLINGQWHRVVDPAEDPGGPSRYVSVPAGPAADRPLDPVRGPLFHVGVEQGPNGSSDLLFRVHHAVTDLWSIALLLADMDALLAEGAAPPAPDAAPAPDPVPPERLERAWAFWRDLYSTETPPLALPPAAVPAAVPERAAPRRCRTASFRLDQDRLRALDRLAKDSGATRYAALLAVQAVALSRLTGVPRVAVAVPMHGRRRAAHRAVGHFVSTAVIPVDTEPDTVRGLLEQTHRRVRHGLAHQLLDHAAYSHASALRDGPRPPAPHAVLVVQQDTPAAPKGLAAALLGHGALPLRNLPATVVEPPPSIGPFPLAVVLTEYGGALHGQVQVDPARHPGWVAERVAALFGAAVDAMVDTPERAPAALDVLPPGEGALLRRWGTGAAAGEAAETSLVDLVLDTARNAPDDVAVEAEDGHLTYRELADRSASVARGLQEAGVGPGEPVGVLMARRRDLVAVLLGVMRGGAVSLPLDPATPERRFGEILTDAACSRVVVDDDTRRSFPARGFRALSARRILRADPVAPTVPVTAGDPAYMLFTSGSTGRPKGVVIPHGAAANLLRWAVGAFTPQELSVVLATTPITFDLSVFELFAPLVRGGRVRLLNGVLDLLRDSPGTPPTLLNTVPSALAALVERGAVPQTLRVVNLAGEALTGSLVESLRAALPGARIFNLYGPSETTTYSTAAELPDPLPDPVPIGGPVRATRLLVLDDQLRRAPVGAAGELFIGGRGLARGYAGRAALTAARFLPDPEHPGERVYRTGDLVRWTPDGQLHYLGRRDHQVKVRGFRVELDDVAAALRRASDAQETAVVAVGEGKERHLVGYLVPSGGRAAGTDDWVRGVRSRMRAQVPPHLVPEVLTVLDRLPRNAHGKIDRAQLTASAAPRARSQDRVEPRTATEQRLRERWAVLLGGAPPGVTDDFLDLGGHSLLLVRLSALIEEEFGVTADLEVLWNHRTIAEQAHWLDRADPGGADPGGAIPRADRTRFASVPGAPRRGPKTRRSS